MTIDEFRILISDITHLPVDQIQAESAFREDLGIDSLQMVHLIIELAKQMQAELGSLKSSQDIQTVASIYQAFGRGRS